MKVLVTGGYGFIGSFVAERFVKEGCEVVIIDNLSSGSRRNIDFKHKSSILSVEDKNCEEVFRNNRFDVVVHLAAQVSVAASIENPRADTQSNILGLSNMLALSQKYGVQKFIFASSAAVYGKCSQMPIQESAPCDPISPYGINKWIGETYCTKWRSIYGLDTLCFRFSNVYGPRQGSVGEGGVVSIFMEGALHGKELTVYGDGGQTRDFIYVEDVAEAIYRASYTGLTGEYNLSTGTESSVRDLVDTLRTLHGDISVTCKESRSGDIYRSVLDNRSIMRSLDWAPKYTFEEGLARTYAWYTEDKPRIEGESAEEKRARPESLLSRILRTSLPYAENVILFALTVWLTATLQHYLNQLIDFKLLYIIIMGILYGNRQSIIAVVLSCGLYTYNLLSNGREAVSLLTDENFFFQCAVYLFIGLVVGYAIERRARLVQTRDLQLEALEEKYTFLNEVYNETRMVKEELQQQIMNNGDSFGKIYSVTKELESLEPEKIFTATVSVVESIMRADTVTIYTVNKYQSYLRLVARSSGSDFDVAKSLKVEELSYIVELLNRKQLFINKELRGDAPLLSAPILNNGEVVAVISIHNMKFENFTLYYQNLFKIITDLISSSLSRALYHVGATGSQRYLEGTSILNADVFAEIMESKRNARSKHGIEFVLLSAGPVVDAPSEWPERIAKSLRETDYLGLGMDGRLLVLLSNSGKADASFVLERFSKNGIVMDFAEEELRYA
jgi:UDP-glucuronate decarboxylase